MSLINKVYTAQDMRDAAKCLFACEVDLKHDNRDISRMLRQAAGMMDRADREAAAKREIAELRKGISELLDALQAIYDEECTSYGTGEVYDKWRKALKGASND